MVLKMGLDLDMDLKMDLDLDMDLKTDLDIDLVLVSHPCASPDVDLLEAKMPAVAHHQILNQLPGSPPIRNQLDSHLICVAQNHQKGTKDNLD